MRKGQKDEPAFHSEEVTEIIERMPTLWPTLIALILTTLVLVLMTLGFTIGYPDVVRGEVFIMGANSPVRMVANATGRLQLLEPNGTRVCRGQVIGYIENGASCRDVLTLDSLLEVSVQCDATVQLPCNLRLGELSSCYNDFLLEHQHYTRLLKSSLYHHVRKSITASMAINGKVLSNLSKESGLHGSNLRDIRRQYVGDSVLNALGAMSDDELRKSRNAMLEYERKGMELQSDILAKNAERAAMSLEMSKSHVQEHEERSSSYGRMMARYNVLVNELRQWKERYLLVSAIDGTLEYLGFWRSHAYVSSSTELFSILPDGNSMQGELYVPSDGAGKIDVGQPVNIKLRDYPYDEYGYIRGKVSGISKSTRRSQTPAGATKEYMVRVSFPDGLRTNYGKQIELNFETLGTGEIVTERRKLIERLFDHLKSSTRQ